MSYSTVLDEWLEHPHKLGHIIGFEKLTPEHDAWIHLFIHKGHGPIRILQAHRGSYKTTCGLIALLIIFMVRPNTRILIARKSQEMAKKLVSAMAKIFETPIVIYWFYQTYGVTSLRTDKWSTTSLRLSVSTRLAAEPSLTAVGITTNQTGDHYDLIWSDDIITTADRYSQKERDATKNYIHELSNIIEPKGVRIFSGTPWHEKDGFALLESMGYPFHRYPLGSIVIADLTPEIIEQKRRTTPRSLWCANMLLVHEHDMNPEFADPIFEDCPHADIALYAFIDGAFGGENNVAIWIGGEYRGLIYLSDAIMYSNSIADHWKDIESLYHSKNIRKFYYEDNAAQKLIGNRLDEMKIPNEGITSTQNKYAKITNTLKPLWNRLRFATNLKPSNDTVEEITENTIPHPLTQVLEYNEETETDDSPDALAGLCRIIAGVDDDFIGEFPQVAEFSTKYIVAFVGTTLADTNMPDRTSVTIVGIIPSPSPDRQLPKIEFTGRTWDKSISHPTVIHELIEFLDKYQPIEVCLQTQQDDSNSKMFIQRLRQAEIEQKVDPKNHWESVIQSTSRHERIMMHVAGNKDRLYTLQSTDQDYLQSIIFYTKTGKFDVEPDSLASAIHRWQTSPNLRNYIYNVEYLNIRR